MSGFRQKLTGALTAAVCVFGLAVTVNAAPPSKPKHQAPPAITGQETPRYSGRKPSDHPKLDKKLNERADANGSGTSRAIVVLKPSCSIDGDLGKVGGRKGRTLGVVSGQVVELSNRQLKRLANSPCVASIHWDRTISGEMNRAAVTVGARAVQQQMGYDGAGVGVAIIDSGIAKHDDLGYTGSNPLVKMLNGQRVLKFVDFVNGRTTPYDDNGHGSHVAGIIAGNGRDTLGARAGIAPAADIVSLKVLDAKGGGHISDVIAALDWVVTNRTTYNIRVVNLSVGAAVTESYNTDPLTVAAKRVVDAGVVLVTAAGNVGKNPKTGKIWYGGITSPGNAPWVLTVGAYSHQGTVSRTDDVMADYSSRGPTAVDFIAKPDVVAPGTGIVSLAVPGSTLYLGHPGYLLNGLLTSLSKPYMSLTGTSMASPMVAGTVALMMQANPKLTPNMAKAIIEYTAQNYGYGSLSQGAGFLNAQGAVTLAKYLNNPRNGSSYPTSRMWSKTIIWGNHKVKRGVIKPAGSAYALNTVWGSSSDADGDNIVWGTACGDSDCDNIVWGTSVMDAANIVWGTYDADGDNIVWGTARDTDGDNIVWGTACTGGNCANVVWGSACGDSDCDNIVWGTASSDADGDDIVWGTACDGDSDCDNIVWGTACSDSDCDNIVWGSSSDADGDNIVWGSSSDSDGDNIVWGSADDDEVAPIYDDPDVPSVFDGIDFDSLFEPPPAEDVLTPVVEPVTTVVAPLTTTTTTVLGGLLGGGF